MKSEPTVQFNLARLPDAARLSCFAEATFRETYEQFNKPGHIKRYVTDHFSEDIQKLELRDPARITLLAELSGKLVGYSGLRRSEAPACVGSQDMLELVRFYVDRDFFGKGIAQKLMTSTKDAARKAGARLIWLGVWEKNPRAIKYYLKSGFREVGEHVFMFGGDPQRDLVLELEL